jgi:hypothetical protein
MARYHPHRLSIRENSKLHSYTLDFQDGFDCKIIWNLEEMLRDAIKQAYNSVH